MNVIQNYLVTVMKGDFTLYETKIFSRIVLHANHVLKGKKISSILGSSFSADGITANLAININDLLSDGSHDYKAVIDAADSLQDKVVKFFRTEQNEWVENRTHLIESRKYVKGSGVLRITVSVSLLEYILDFVHGNFSMYDFEKSLTLPSAYAVRLYWLTCSMKNPTRYPIVMLREMLGTGEKYKQNKDFIKRCIETPCRILKEMHMNGYTYSKSGAGKKAVINFFPVKRQEQTKNELTAQASLSAWVKPAIKNYLQSVYGFTNEELRSNKNTLFEFCHLPDAEQKIVSIVQRARLNDCGKGYIINAMKKATANYKYKNKIKTIAVEMS